MKKETEQEKNKKVAVYQAKNGALELRQDLGNETVWASKKQIAEIFAIDRSVVSRHIKNIFGTKSWMKKWFVQNLHKPLNMEQ